MSVFFVGDLHLGHRSIARYGAGVPGARPRGVATNVVEHDAWVFRQMMSVNPSKRTLWWILGDVAMDPNSMELLNEVPGHKRLILGNHDLFPTEEYLKCFEWLGGGIKKYGMWVTHMPLHPLELYGKPNIHGHTHYDTINGDDRYLNAAIEWLPDQRPISLDEVRAS